ncbi:hypothetical protein RYH80_15990 [Halobaculum sp. MBLA0147]
MAKPRGWLRLPGTEPDAPRRNVLVWLLYLYVVALVLGLLYSVGAF